MNAPDVAFAECETDEPGAAYNAWIRAEFTRRMRMPQGKTPHDQVMTEMEALIAQVATA